MTDSKRKSLLEPSGRKSVIEALSEELKRLRSDESGFMTPDDIDALLASALERHELEQDDDVTETESQQGASASPSPNKKCLIEEIFPPMRIKDAEAEIRRRRSSGSAPATTDTTSKIFSTANTNSKLAEKIRAAAEAASPSSSSQLPQVLEALRDIEDPMIPVRGHGLVTLRRLLERRDAHCLAQCDVIMDALRTCLAHEDSYVYLLAINALQALAWAEPALALTTLAQEYADFDASKPCVKGNEEKRAAEGGEKVERPADLRMKIGEALMKGIRLNGEK